MYLDDSKIRNVKPSVKFFKISVDPLRRDIQVYFDGQSLAVEIIHDVESLKTSATCQHIMHKINRPALVKCFRRYQRCRLRTGRRCFPLRQKLYAFSLRALLIYPLMFTVFTLTGFRGVPLLHYTINYQT